MWLVIGNCQAEALRQILDAVGDRPYRTVLVPPVHEIEASDLPHLEVLLRQTAVLSCQPIRNDYRDLPLGTGQLAAVLPAAATVLRWPVIRYAGLYPFQVIVRRPADRSVVPPPVPYHDLRTIAAALEGRSIPTPGTWTWNRPRFGPWQNTAGRRCPTGRPGTPTSASRTSWCRRDAMPPIRSTIPATPCWSPSPSGCFPRWGWIDVPNGWEPHCSDRCTHPLSKRVLDALNVSGQARTHWWSNGRALDPESVHAVQLHWYRSNLDFLQLAVQRHGQIMDLLGLSANRVTR